jgi:hypothetical protein
VAIAFDSGNKGSITGASSITVSHTCTGSDLALVVFAACANSTDFLATATATYNGVSMGTARIAFSLANLSLYAWVLAGPATGANNVVITPSGSAYLDVFTASFTGVDQTTPVSAVASAGSSFIPTPQSLSISVPTGGYAVDMFFRRTTASSTTPDASQTRISTELVPSGGVSTSGASYKADATAMVWTHAATSGASQGIVALAAASGGGGGGLPRITGRQMTGGFFDLSGGTA